MQLIFELIKLHLYILGNKVSSMPEIAISVHTKALMNVRLFSAFSIKQKIKNIQQGDEKHGI